MRNQRTVEFPWHRRQREQKKRDGDKAVLDFQLALIQSQARALRVSTAPVEGMILAAKHFAIAIPVAALITWLWVNYAQ